MTFKAILTNRDLKNKLTGIDLYVSDYQEIPHKIRNTYLYHVIAVTNLFYYKSSKEHKQSDVVQFMVSKTFEEFEELYHKLYKRFPSVNFPPLPSRSLLNNKTDERRDCMDKVMKLVANTQKLSSSTMLIEFLKGKKETVTQHPLVVQEEKVVEESVSEENEEPTANDIFDTTEEAEEENLFDVSPSKTPQSCDKPTGVTGGVSNLVISGDDRNKSSLFDDDEGKIATGDDELFQPPPADARKSAFDKNYTIDFNDSDDLLDVNDDVDDLLKLSESSEKHSEIKVKKPSVPARIRASFTDTSEQPENDTNVDDKIFTRAKSHSLKKVRSDSGNLDDIFSKNKKGGLFDEDDDDDLFSSPKTTPTTKGDISGMGHEDILNYIKANDS